MASVIASFLAGALAGCGAGPNESDMADTKGTVAPDAPKSQSDYYHQQQAKAGAKPKAKAK